MQVMLSDDMSSIIREHERCRCDSAICGTTALLVVTDSLCTDSVHRLLSFGHFDTHGFDRHLMCTQHVYMRYIRIGPVLRCSTMKHCRQKQLATLCARANPHAHFSTHCM